MAAKKEKISFEEAYDRLRTAAEDIVKDDVPLEKAIESYKEGRKYYEVCSGILGEARQLIKLYDRESGLEVDFDEN